MSSKKGKHKTLSEQVTDTFVPRPLADPELDSEDETVAKFAELDDDDLDFESKELSDIRKRNVKPLSEISAKYKGMVSSRKELESDEDDASEVVEPVAGEESDDSDDLEQYRKKLKNCQLESEPDESLGTDEEVDDEAMGEEVSEQEDDSDYDSPGEDVSQSEDEDEAALDDNSELLKEADPTAEIQKGLAVQNQLKMWEKLLEVRIHSQKMLIKANSLPQPAVHEKLRSESDEFSKLAKETQDNVANLLEKMIEIQTTLTKQFPETKDLLKPLKKRRAGDSPLAEPPAKIFASVLEENFDTYREYRNSVLHKWHDRTKILTPGSSKGGNKSDFDVVKKIDAVLLNKSDLVKKSQVVKGNYKLFGVKEEPVAEGNETEAQSSKEDDVSSAEVYDDTDFYHQQLRELIEFKANSAVSPAEMSKQFAELQKLRQKMKKKVDTRASKGRKIRYVVHNKLVNFMAPYDNSEWTDESKNELYRSLFAT